MLHREALRDRFVCGVRSESIQKRLLSEADLTISKAIELAQYMEAAHKNAQAMKTPAMSVAAVEMPRRHVNSPRANGGPPSAGNKPCHRCGSEGHSGSECSFREVRGVASIGLYGFEPPLCL